MEVDINLYWVYDLPNWQLGVLIVGTFAVMGVGGLLDLFWVENVLLHAILVAVYAIFIGLMIFLTAAMDNPYRGNFSVTPDVYQEVLDEVMTPAKPPQTPPPPV
jgi:hypothetical protein